MSIRKNNFWRSALVSFIICLILFYIDEGNYSLRGILKPGNLVAMSIYYFFIFAGQWLMLDIVFRKPTNTFLRILAHITGVIVGVAIPVFLFLVAFRIPLD